MRYTDKEAKNAIRVNDHITISNIPSETHRYIVNGRTPLEWIIDRYYIKTDKASGIVHDPNKWFEETGDDIVSMIKRITHTSIETAKHHRHPSNPLHRRLDTRLTPIIPIIQNHTHHGSHTKSPESPNKIPRIPIQTTNLPSNCRFSGKFVLNSPSIQDPKSYENHRPQPPQADIRHIPRATPRITPQTTPIAKLPRSRPTSGNFRQKRQLPRPRNRPVAQLDGPPQHEPYDSARTVDNPSFQSFKITAIIVPSHHQLAKMQPTENVRHRTESRK